MNFLYITILILGTISTAKSWNWDFAVALKNQIIFYDENWAKVTSAAHQFNEISAIAFDETEEIIYFNDQNHEKGILFTLKLTNDNDDNENHVTQKLLLRTKNEMISGIAYDPLERILYWTDSLNKKIYKLNTDYKNNTPSVLIDFENDKSIPDGITIDICKRKLYWTNSNYKNATIESSNLNGSNRTIIINSNLYLPHGITIDEYSNRIYWVVDQQGSHFTIESSNLDGTNREIIVKGLHNEPYNLAITNNSIYWTDITQTAIWNISKISYANEQPNKVKDFQTPPRGIIARKNFLTTLENDNTCKELIKNIKTHLLKPIKELPLKPKTDEENFLHYRKELYCLNKGEYNPKSGKCICKIGYVGTHCESYTCNNFCVHGTCSISAIGFPECTCQEGFNGIRCENYKCSDYCLNNGKCEIKDNKPICHCTDRRYEGNRCEKNTTDICLIFCEIKKLNPNKDIPFGCNDVCEEYSDHLNNITNNYSYYSDMNTNFTNDDNLIMKTSTMCSNVYNKSVIFVVIGILTGLTLVLFIVLSIKRIYKPARPRIKKTFVVQKRVSQTPLTSRPCATEQCEITIENCCNMNICDTPCFDPKLLQQNISFDKNMVEDKKILVNNMEDDLY